MKESSGFFWPRYMIWNLTKLQVICRPCYLPRPDYSILYTRSVIACCIQVLELLSASLGTCLIEN